MQPRPSIPSSELEQYTGAFIELYEAQQDLISEALGNLQQLSATPQAMELARARRQKILLLLAVQRIS